MQETNILDIGKGRTIKIPVNYQHFVLDYSSNPENKGWAREDVIHILECVKNGQMEELDMDSNLMNDIGTFFEDGMCVKPDEGNATNSKTKKYEVRCHEWGDGSDYNWCYCDTKEEAVNTVKDFYANDPGNVYEHLYVLEIRPDGTKKNIPVDR